MEQNARVNTASENLGKHLATLLEKLQHPTDYEGAFYYFLEEFAGDGKFIEQSERQDAPHLLTLVTHTVRHALGKDVELESARAWFLAEFGFRHGAAAVDGRGVLFFYFESVHTGLAAIIPGPRGAAEVARFRLPGELGGNPVDN